MKIPLIIGAVIIIILASLIVFIPKKSSFKDNNTSSTNSLSQNTVENTKTNINQTIVSDACSIFSTSTISTALGGISFKEGKLTAPTKTTDNLPFTECTWETSNDNAADFTVSVYAKNYLNVEHAKDELSTYKQTSGNFTTEDANFGDEGFYHRSSNTANAIQSSAYFRKGTVVYRVGISRLDKLDSKKTEDAIKTIISTKF